MTITGLTRAMHEDSGHPRYRERLGSTGVARTDVEVRVVDADDNPLPAGEIGEVVCRGGRHHARLLEQPGGDGVRPEGRLAAHRRHGRVRRRRFSDPQGPLEQT